MLNESRYRTMIWCSREQCCGRIFFGGEGFEAREEFAAVEGKVWERAEGSFLKAAMRIEGVER